MARDLKELQRIEWTGTRKGLPAYGGLSDYEYPCCMQCGGVRPYAAAFMCWPAETVGHRFDCPLKAEITAALDVERARMVERAKVAESPDRYHFALHYINRSSARNGQHTYKLTIGTEGMTTDLALTRHEIEELVKTGIDFLGVDGVE